MKEMPVNVISWMTLISKVIEEVKPGLQEKEDYELVFDRPNQRFFIILKEKFDKGFFDDFDAAIKSEGINVDYKFVFEE